MIFFFLVAGVSMGSDTGSKKIVRKQEFWIMNIKFLLNIKFAFLVITEDKQLFFFFFFTSIKSKISSKEFRCKWSASWCLDLAPNTRLSRKEKFSDFYRYRALRTTFQVASTSWYRDYGCEVFHATTPRLAAACRA